MITNNIIQVNLDFFLTVTTNHVTLPVTLRPALEGIPGALRAPLPPHRLVRPNQVISGHCTLIPTLVAPLATPELCRPCSSHCFLSAQVSSQPAMHTESGRWKDSPAR